MFQPWSLGFAKRSRCNIAASIVFTDPQRSLSLGVLRSQCLAESRKVRSYVSCKRSGAFCPLNSPLYMHLKTKAECSLQLLGTALRRYLIDFDRNYCKALEMIRYTDWLAKQRERHFRGIFYRVKKWMKMQIMPESCIRRSIDSTWHNLLQHVDMTLKYGCIFSEYSEIFDD